MEHGRRTTFPCYLLSRDAIAESVGEIVVRQVGTFQGRRLAAT